MLKRIEDMTPEEAEAYFRQTYLEPAIEYLMNESLLRIMKESGVDPHGYAISPRREAEA
jgi:hypothetical protein